MVERRGRTSATNVAPVRPSHGPILPVKPATDLALPVEELNASPGPLDWKALVVAGLLALGFSSTFLGPVLRIQSDNRSGGVILGDSTSRPLAVPVTVVNGAATTITTQPSTGLVTDALARAATELDGTVSYTSRGSSIYLQTYLNQPNSATGTWTVQLNGRPVVDLSQPILRQGDAITMTYQPQ